MAGRIHRSAALSRHVPFASRVARVRALAEAVESRRLLAGSTLDPSFGVGGIARVTPTGDLYDYPLQLVRQSDGKSLMVGVSGSGSESRDIALVRRNADGSPDATFDGDGVRVIDFAEDAALRFIRQRSNGGYEAVLWRGSTFYVARLLGSGAFDTTWGSDGLLPLQGWDNSTSQDVTMDASGRVLRTVQPAVTSASNVRLQRFNTDGSPDTSFGPGGIFIDAGVPFKFAQQVRVLASGRILVLAKYTDGDVPVVVAYNDDGSRAVSFGANGLADAAPSHPALGANNFLKYLLVQSDGSVIVAGVGSSSPVAPNLGRPVLTRLTPSGQRDLTYGDAGTGTALVSIGPNSATSISNYDVDGTGRAVVTGVSPFIGSVAARITTSGVLDTTFDGDGIAALPLGSELLNASPGPVAIGGDGRVLVASQGYRLYSDRESGDLVLHRLSGTGTSDATFNAGSPVVVSTTGPTAMTSGHSVASSNGAVLVFGRSQPRYGLSVARITASGLPDLSNGPAGVRQLATYGDGTSSTVTDAVARGDGGAFVACTFSTRANGATTNRIGIYAVRADGSPDPAFGTGGLLEIANNSSTPNVTTRIVHLAADPLTGGVFVLLQRSYNPGNDFWVNRFTATGALDLSFAGTGGRTVPIVNGFGWVNRMFSDASRQMVTVVGETGDQVIRLFQFRFDGSFAAGGGTVTAAGPAIAGTSNSSLRDGVVTPWGTLVLLRGFSSSASPSTVYTQQLLSIDLSTATFTSGFGTAGVVSVSTPTETAVSVAVDVASQRIVVGSRLVTISVNAPHAGYLRRFLFDGRPDIGFGTDGRATVEMSTASVQLNTINYLTGLKVGENGAITAVGAWGGSGYTRPFIARYLADAAEAPKVVALAQLVDSAAREPYLRLTFDQAVGHSFAAGDVELTNLTTGDTLAAGDIAVTALPGGTEFQLRTPGFPGGRLPNGNYRLRIAASSVTSAPPYALPMSADYATTFRALAGDANADGIANFDDLLVLAANYNQSGRTYATGDFNYDGTCDFDDLLILAATYNVSLVSGPAAIGGPAGIGGDDDEDASSPGNAADLLA